MLKSFFRRRQDKDWTLRDPMTSMFMVGAVAGASGATAAFGFSKIGAAVGFLTPGPGPLLQEGLISLVAGSILAAAVVLAGRKLVRYAEARYRMTDLNQSNPAPDPVAWTLHKS